MNISREKTKSSDIEKIKNYLLRLGFVCSSYPTAQCLIYSKNSDIVIIKNNEEKC